MASARDPSPEQVAGHVREIEQRAAAAHDTAQALNKAGKFAEAEAQYALMRRLENEAAQLAKGTECAACVMGAEGAPLAAGGGQQGEQPALYRTLQQGCAWREACAATGADPSAAQQRALGAVLGSAVGDAAAMPVQWIYDLSVLQALLDRRLAEPKGADWGLAFLDPPSSPFLKPEDGYASVGRFSPYFEAVTPLLASLADLGGLHCGDYAAKAEAAFGEGSGFRGYCNASMRGFLRARSQRLAPPATGTDDKQADCVARLAPLVASFGGDAAALAPCVEAATRVTQDEAVAWALAGAAVLERLVVPGLAPREAVAATAQELRSGAGRFAAVPQAPAIAGMFDQVVALRAEPRADVVNSLGRNCHLPNSCQTPLHALLHAEWWLEQQAAGAALGGGWGLEAAAKQGVYKSAVRDALAGGGCCASRACYAGACLGGWLGPDAVPPAWAAKCEGWGVVMAQAETLCAARGG